ncbi:zinc finger protein 737-like isoform X2 [Malaya genurostris]|uniref:zinc finger protein 737-like isoform X2 n=1 Tax=Malaya genurostris TaxID=325434 RepID=UPI0026F3B84F|nr:zinc finger protein 737-like isoform X2 [Malaya genurostris]
MSFSAETLSIEEDPEFLDEYSSHVPCPPSALIARDKFCRLCLKKSSTFLLPLIAKLELVSVMEMLVDVTGIEIEVNPLYPTKVCSNCMTKLDYAYSVRQEFLNSSELLLKLAVENRLPAYYAQFDDEVSLDPGFRDEIALSNHGNENDKQENLTLSTSRDELTENGEELTVLDRQVSLETITEIRDKEHCSASENIAQEIENEKFVYSWKELIKPKRKKKDKPKNPLTGIKRKAKADAKLLDQFPQTTCYICDTAHQTLQQRDEHLNSHIGMVPHRCETCSTEAEPVISKSVVTLNRHRLMHRLPHKCEFCYRRFISSGSQYTHVWSMHMGDTEVLTCDYCGKGFNQKRSFQAHVRRHRYKANGKYKCNVCEETCGSSLLLIRHKRKHTGEKNFSCPYCSKSFSRACNLLTHKRIHTDERCHKCPDCESTFRNIVTLRKHRERFHQGKNPTSKIDRNPYVTLADGRKQFICKYDGCSYTAYSSTSISRHKARHSKRYACGECGKRFAEPNLVRRHQDSMHNEKLADKASKQMMAIQPVSEIQVIEKPLKLEPDYEVEIVDEIGETVEVIYTQT